MQNCIQSQVCMLVADGIAHIWCQDFSNHLMFASQHEFIERTVIQHSIWPFM